MSWQSGQTARLSLPFALTLLLICSLLAAASAQDANTAQQLVPDSSAALEDGQASAATIPGEWRLPWLPGQAAVSLPKTRRRNLHYAASIMSEDDWQRVSVPPCIEQQQHTFLFKQQHDAGSVLDCALSPCLPASLFRAETMALAVAATALSFSKP